MSVEQIITVTSLIIVVIFYIFTITVFLVARKSRVNVALASQKGSWLMLVIAIALPSYSDWYSPLTMPWRAVLWVVLAICSIWVMYEVYRVNWQGSIHAFFYRLYCRATRSCTQDERPWV